MSGKGKLAFDDEIIKIAASGKRPGLLLHVCCAPCGSYVIENLSQFFEITLLYYNPNIYPREEFDKRGAEFYKLPFIEYGGNTRIIIGEYDAERFERLANPFAGEPEGGGRCAVCFRMRLEETVRLARDGGFDYFTTTLSVSPHKNAALLNEIGAELSEKYGGARYLYSDFKKKDGYKRSIQLSKEYGLYRQSYCGCRYSYRAEEPPSS